MSSSVVQVDFIWAWSISRSKDNQIKICNFILKSKYETQSATRKYWIQLNSDGYELSGAALKAAAFLQTDGAKIQCYQVSES